MPEAVISKYERLVWLMHRDPLKLKQRFASFVFIETVKWVLKDSVQTEFTEFE